MQISPGYNHGSTEVPTRETIGLSCSGMSVFDIDPSQIATSLIGQLVSTDSLSSLPAPGWMWVDQYGNLWGRNNNGIVRIFRSHGGWESNRYPFIHSGQSASHTCRPGELIRFGQALANDSGETSARFEYLQSSDRALALPAMAVPNDTGVSGGYVNCTFRGFTRFFCPDFAPPTGGRRYQLLRNTVLSPHWVNIVWLRNNISVGVQGETSIPELEEQAEDYISGFLYGPAMRI